MAFEQLGPEEHTLNRLMNDTLFYNTCKSRAIEQHVTARRVELLFGKGIGAEQS